MRVYILNTHAAIVFKHRYFGYASTEDKGLLLQSFIHYR
jgi:hypothetical protein